ncbi:MAG: helix-turn-helix domain-containing protein [Gemmatimonadaceae bacterium]
MKAVTVLREARARSGLTQRDLARRARTAQSVITRIESGQSSPTIETLSRLLLATGFSLDVELVPRSAIVDPLIEAYKGDIDRTLLRRNLDKTVDERVKSLQALTRLANEARRAGRSARAAGKKK